MQTRKIAIIEIATPCYDTTRALLGKIAHGRQEGTSSQWKADRSGDSDYIHYNDGTIFLLTNREVSSITVSSLSRHTLDKKVRLFMGAILASDNQALARYEETIEL
jgi:hypothetical protein